MQLKFGEVKILSKINLKIICRFKKLLLPLSNKTIKVMNLSKLNYEELKTYISIGFCQPKFYKPSVWAKAKRIMDFLVKEDIGVIPFDFGRGKGKYQTEGSLTIAEVVNLVAAKYGVLEKMTYGGYQINWEQNKKCVVYWGFTDVWQNNTDTKEVAIQKAKNWIDQNPEYNG